MSHHTQEATRDTSADAWAFPSQRESAGVTATALGVLASTGVIGAAYALGADWLATPVLGLPAGVWGVPAVYGLIRWGMVRPGWVIMQAAGGLNRLLFGGGRLPALGHRRSDLTPWQDLLLSIGGATASLSSRVGAPAASWAAARTSGRIPDPETFDRRFSAWLDRVSWPARPFHVALVGVADRFKRGLTGKGTPGVRWFLGDSRLDDQVACERYGLDAVLTADADGRLSLATHERGGKDAAWYDWGRRMPLAYASVFPGRVDPFLVTIGACDASDLPVVATLVRAAGVFGRHPQRLGGRDRARGRRPIELPVASDFGEEASHPVVAVMDELHEHVLAWPVGRPASGAVRSAARVVSAWLAGTVCALDPEDRLGGLEAAARILSDEPEAMLRLGAVRLAAGQDDEGLAALTEADAILRASGEEAQVDPFAFLQAELEAGESNPMTVGRVAAGICMVCARSSTERLPYLRDDIMDDMRYAEWLIGADPDRLLLYRVFDEIARSRQPTAEPMLQAA